MGMDLEYASECFDYDPETGVLRWKTRPLKHFTSSRIYSSWNSTYAGKEAGTRSTTKRARTSRRSIRVAGGTYKAHRLAWLLYYGEWPAGQIDHIDGDAMNNRISNLREATNAENQRNRGKNLNNTSGYKGVYWDKPVSKWRAQLSLHRRSVFFGYFDTPEDAARAYQEGARRIHGEFYREEQNP